MEWFLNAKHWQIFLLIFLLPFILFVLGVVLISCNYNPGILFFIFPLAIGVSLITGYGWMWSVGSKLSGYNFNENKDNSKLFRFFIMIPLVLMSLILAFLLYGATSLSLGSYSMAGIMYSSLIVIMPLQLLITISMFYCFFFVAQRIKTAEEKRTVAFDECFYEFVLVAILPIGVWILQPRINKLAKE